MQNQVVSINPYILFEPLCFVPALIKNSVYPPCSEEGGLLKTILWGAITSETLFSSSFSKFSRSMQLVMENLDGVVVQELD